MFKLNIRKKLFVACEERKKESMCEAKVAVWVLYLGTKAHKYCIQLSSSLVSSLGAYAF